MQRVCVMGCERGAPAWGEDDYGSRYFGGREGLILVAPKVNGRQSNFL